MSKIYERKYEIFLHDGEYIDTPEVVDATFPFHTIRDETRNLGKYLENLKIKIETLFDKNILDLGCGAGNFAKDIYENQDFKNKNTFVVSYDYDDCKKNYDEENIARGFFTDLPFKNNIFDLVISLCAMPKELRSPNLIQKATLEVIRVLKPGGQAILLPFDVKRFKLKISDEEMKTIQENDPHMNRVLKRLKNGEKVQLPYYYIRNRLSNFFKKEDLEENKIFNLIKNISDEVSFLQFDPQSEMVRDILEIGRVTDKTPLIIIKETPNKLKKLLNEKKVSEFKVLEKPNLSGITKKTNLKKYIEFIKSKVSKFYIDFMN